MNWCALPHDMTYTGNPSQGLAPVPTSASVQQPPQPPQLPPSAALPPAKKPKAPKAPKEAKPPKPPRPPKEPGAKRQRSTAAPAAPGSGGKKGKAEALPGDDGAGASEVLGGRPVTPDPDLADPELAGARETANPALDSEVVVIHAGSRLLRVGLAGLHAPPPLLLPHCVAYRRAAAVATSATACSASAPDAAADAAEDDAAEAVLGSLTRQLRVPAARLHTVGSERLWGLPRPGVRTGA